MPESQYSVAARPFKPQRGPRFVTVAAAFFIALAVVKPWPDPAADRRPGDPSPTTNARVIASVAIPSPDPSRGPNTMPCLAGAETQIVTVERSAGREVRSWIAVVDEVASDASDLREEAITIFSTDVVGIGVCGPDSVGSAGRTPGPSGAATRDPQAASMITVVVGSSATTASRVVGVGAPLAGQDVGTDFARLFGPPSAARDNGGSTASGAPPIEPGGGATSPPDGSATGSGRPRSSAPALDRAEPGWPAGSYAIAFRYRADGPSVVRWVRVEIRPGPSASY